MSDLTEMVDERNGKFTWGKLIKIHHFDNFQIVEYLPEVIGKEGEFEDLPSFHPYINEKDISRSYTSLKKAVVGAIVYENEGSNSKADQYFFKMIGGE